MNTPYLKALSQEDQKVNPLFNLLGARLIEASGGKARIDLPLSPSLAQGMGVVAGGILATLADEAMAHAAISLLDGDKFMVTAEMNIRYIKASDPKREGVLSATGSVVKLGRSIIVTEAAVHDDMGRLLATAGGSFFATKRRGS